MHIKDNSFRNLSLINLFSEQKERNKRDSDHVLVKAINLLKLTFAKKNETKLSSHWQRPLSTSFLLS